MSLEEDVARRTALRARAHPIRLRMLSLMTGAPMSAAELGRELEISQALSSYHLRFLVDAGLVQLVEESNNRGGRERRYRYDVEAVQPAAAKAVSTEAEGHTLMLEAAIEELRRRNAQRVSTGRGVAVDAELWISEAEWDRFRETVAKASIRLHEKAKKPHAPGTRHVNVTAALFEMEP